ncbi:hypothetical protein OUZ56_003440 [Daphnia magna]|uniref:Uncharacterized protein n=1 Tax=Daphnia magna TaxID=35525 RepID=A0ABR0A8S3_9CRUS|nr:hypothetical protein OUZ56_003440 [Daphnia magna]
MELLNQHLLSVHPKNVHGSYRLYEEKYIPRDVAWMSCASRVKISDCVVTFLLCCSIMSDHEPAVGIVENDKSLAKHRKKKAKQEDQTVWDRRFIFGIAAKGYS